MTAQENTPVSPEGDDGEARYETRRRLVGGGHVIGDVSGPRWRTVVSVDNEEQRDRFFAAIKAGADEQAAVRAVDETPSVSPGEGERGDDWSDGYRRALSPASGTEEGPADE